jgi:hypothetical protein
MLLSVSVTYEGTVGACGVPVLPGYECNRPWFAFAEVFPASVQSVCPPPGLSKSAVGEWFGEVRLQAGTESGTAIVPRRGVEGPLIVCVYVNHYLANHEVEELVGKFGPFDPQPPPPPPSPPPPPPSPPPSPPATAPAPPQSVVVVPLHPKPLTRAQKLAKALRACSKKPKRERARCRATAQKLYGPQHKHRGGSPAPSAAPA